MPIFLSKTDFFVYSSGHEVIYRDAVLVFAEVSLRARQGALQVRSRRKSRVNVYRRTPREPFFVFLPYLFSRVGQDTFYSRSAINRSFAHPSVMMFFRKICTVIDTSNYISTDRFRNIYVLRYLGQVSVHRHNLPGVCTLSKQLFCVRKFPKGTRNKKKNGTPFFLGSK